LWKALRDFLTFNIDFIMDKPFWQQLRDKKLGGPVKEHKVNKKKSLDKYYEIMAERAPEKCENCGRSLESTVQFHPHGHICHILEKNDNAFPSVATDIINCWYGCLDCHTLYDKGPDDKRLKMKILPTLRKRLKLFYGKLTDREKAKVPDYLRDGKK
jgi:hypothetical protein